MSNFSDCQPDTLIRIFDRRQCPGLPAGLSSLERRREMDNLFSQYFPHMVAALMLMFMLILGGLSLQDALRGRKN